MDPCYVYTIKRYPENLIWSSKFYDWVTPGGELEQYQRIFTNKSVAKRKAKSLCIDKNQNIINDMLYNRTKLTNLDFQIVVCENILIPSYEEVVKPNERE